MRKTVLTFGLLMALVLFISCRNEAPSNANNVSPPAQPSPLKKAELKVTSKAFQEGGMIPKKYTCDDANISPPLAWDSVPEKAKSLALITDDPDAPGKTWVHWVAFNIPANVKELPENIPAQEAISVGGHQGTNDFKKLGYGGPCPPSGTHRYYFHLYALDTFLNLDSSATKDQLLKAMEGHVLAEGELMGKYQK
ncbi:MAG TPA: YbhB/YbcL family Raf kinase inhibitor-like protein [Pyrinomonadaceae bacterium]